MCQWSKLGNADLYAIVNVPFSANASEVRSAYRQAALRSHPDKGGSAEAFHLVAHAFEVLSCPISRALYDKKHLRHKAGCFQVLHSPSSETDSKLLASRSDLAFARTKSNRGRQHLNVCIDTMLKVLGNILHSLEAKHRQLAIAAIPERVRRALLTFMEAHPDFIPASYRSQEVSGQRFSKFPRTRGGLRTIRGSQKTKYQASIRVKGLRLYTREHSKIETAVEHQIALSRLRHEIANLTTSNPLAWYDAEILSQKCSAFLAESCEGAESELGLRIHLEFPASPWCSSRSIISSPTYSSLKEGLEMNAKLLKAKCTSWESLRSIWIHILMTKKRSRYLSLREAEAIVDRARHAFLIQNTHRIAWVVQRMLARRELQNAQALKMKRRQVIRERKRIWKKRWMEGSY